MNIENIKKDIITIIKEFLNKDFELQCDTVLSEIGVDSINIIQIVVLIEEKYGIEFEDEKLTYKTLHTVNSISEYIFLRISERK